MKQQSPMNGQLINCSDHIPLPNLGFELAVQKLEGGDPKDRDDGMSILRKLIAGKTQDGYWVERAEQRDAMIYTGWIYLEGWYDIPTEEKKAFRLARKAAKRFKDPFAYALLGECYYRGAGTIADAQKACRIWRRGWRKSQNGACALHLAHYYNHMGIDEKAASFAESAVRSGIPEATPLLKKLQGKQTPTPLIETKEDIDGNI